MIMNNELIIKSEFNQHGLVIYVKSELLEKYFADLSGKQLTNFNHANVYSLPDMQAYTLKQKSKNFVLRYGNISMIQYPNDNGSHACIISPLLVKGITNGMHVQFNGFYEKNDVKKYIRDLMFYAECLTNDRIKPFYKGRKERLEIEAKNVNEIKKKNANTKRQKTIQIRKQLKAGRYSPEGEEYRVFDETDGIIAWLSRSEIKAHLDAISRGDNHD